MGESSSSTGVGPSTQTDADTSTASSGSSGSAAPDCGNGVVDPGEDCDELDLIDGDGCNVDCVVSGKELWTSTYDHAGGNDRGFGMAVAEDGMIAVVGFVTDDAGDQQTLIQLWDEAGAIVWTEVSSNSGPDAAEQVFFDDDGDLIVCGRIAVTPRGGGKPQDQAWIERFGRDRQSKWRVVLDEPGGSRFKDCRPFADGDFVVGGTTGGLTDGFGLFGRYGLDGTRVWLRQHGEPPIQDTQLTGVLEGPDGEVVIGGRRLIDGDWLSLLTAYTADGQDVAWDTDPGADLGVDEQFAIARVGPTVYGMGRVFFQGGTYGWLGRFENGVQGGSKVAAEVGVGNEFHRLAGAGNGDLLIAGSLRGHDIWILRYGPNFEERWTVELAGDGDGDDKAWDIALAPDGSVVVAGYITTATEDANIWVGTYSP